MMFDAKSKKRFGAGDAGYRQRIYFLVRAILSTTRAGMFSRV